MNKSIDEETKIRILDFSKCKYYEEIHEIIRIELELPYWYGKNLDAFWDAITGLMEVPADITFIFKPEHKIDPLLKEHIYKLINIAKKAEEKYGDIEVHLID